MELILNLAWMVLAAVIVGLWLHHSRGKGVDRRTQFVAVAMLILILFPIISVSDDLQMAQNPAEEDQNQRRDSTPGFLLADYAVVAILPQAEHADVLLVFLCYHGLGQYAVPSIDNPALSAFQNRPPPIA